MEMLKITGHDLYLLGPELSLVSLAMLLLLLDLFVSHKKYLATIGLLGLAVPIGFSVVLWLGLGDKVNASEYDGILAGTLLIDRFSVFFKFFFLGVVVLVMLASTEFVRKFSRFQTEYYALLMMSASGMMLLASTVELITIYIALELTALPIAALVTFYRHGRSAEAGMKFLILSAISSAFLLYGMVMVYGFTGSTLLSEIAGHVDFLENSVNEPTMPYALLLGIALMIAGFGFKITVAPFHMWAPDVYEGAPTPVTAFLSVASKAAGFAVILRVFYLAFPTNTLTIEWGAIFAVLAAVSMTIGNLTAIVQNNIKRLLAYSTIAHAGYLMIGVASVASKAFEDHGAIGPTGVLFYLVGYAVTNLAAFFVIIAVSLRIGSDQIDDYAGLARRTPYLAAVLAFAMLSLIGVPPTVGFMVKIYIFGAAINSGLAWLVAIAVVNSVVSAFYYIKVIKVMYVAEPVGGPVTAGPFIRLALLLTAGAIVLLGLYPTPLIEFARSAAEVFEPVS